MYSEEWDCVSCFYGNDVGCRKDWWVGHWCYQDVDLVMRWDGVIGNTIITVTLTLSLHTSCGRQKWCRNEKNNTLTGVN